jgi:hypothetical protein
MSFRALVACVLVAPLAGCAELWQRPFGISRAPISVRDGSVPTCPGEGPAVCDQSSGAPAPCGPTCGPPCGPACAPAPPCPPKEKVIRIKLVPPKAPCEKKEAQGAPPPAPVNAPPEVMLVPRTVFVPFVAQTPTGPARVLNLQGAVPLIPPAPEQNQGLPPPTEKKEEKQGTPPPAAPPAPPCSVEVTPSCCPSDLDAINRRLDRIDCILQQLCPPPCPPSCRGR